MFYSVPERSLVRYICFKVVEVCRIKSQFKHSIPFQDKKTQAMQPILYRKSCTQTLTKYHSLIYSSHIPDDNLTLFSHLGFLLVEWHVIKWHFRFFREMYLTQTSLKMLLVTAILRTGEIVKLSASNMRDNLNLQPSSLKRKMHQFQNRQVVVKVLKFFSVHRAYKPTTTVVAKKKRARVQRKSGLLGSRSVCFICAWPFSFGTVLRKQKLFRMKTSWKGGITKSLRTAMFQSQLQHH